VLAVVDQHPTLFLAKLLHEMLQRLPAQVAPGKDAHAVHLLGRLAPHAPDARHVEAVDELLCLIGMNHAEAVGLALVGGYLRQKLTVRHPCRGRQSGCLDNALLDFLGDINR
jgi:hypothetical protein